MKELFLTVWNMSLIGSAVIVLVLFVRFCIRKLPKGYAYLLWLPVGFRLLLPFSLSSIVSFFNLLPSATVTLVKSEAVHEAISSTLSIQTVQPLLNTPAVSDIVNTPVTTTPVVSIDWVSILAYGWIIVLLLFLGYAMSRYYLLQKEIQPSHLWQKNIYQSQKVSSPFVSGIFRYRIYLPMSYQPTENDPVLYHEMTHMQRKDPLYKLLGYIILCVHWFNPLVWLAYYLFTMDMEMSCDEAVIRCLGKQEKKEYSNSLLAFASPREPYAFYPLYFSETCVSRRIKNILHYQKPKRWLSTLLLVSVLLFMVGCVTNSAPDTLTTPIEQTNGNTVNKPVSTEFYYHLPIDHERLTCNFGCYANHNAYDFIDIEDENGPVYAVADATVAEVGENETQGHYVILEHASHTYSLYAHMQEITVQQNDTVLKGAVLGTIGDSGKVTGTHVHFSFLKMNTTKESTSLLPYFTDVTFNDSVQYYLIDSLKDMLPVEGFTLGEYDEELYAYPVIAG